MLSRSSSLLQIRCHELTMASASWDLGGLAQKRRKYSDKSLSRYGCGFRGRLLFHIYRQVCDAACTS